MQKQKYFAKHTIFYTSKVNIGYDINYNGRNIPNRPWSGRGNPNTTSRINTNQSLALDNTNYRRNNFDN